MPWSRSSRKKLETCHQDLQRLFNMVDRMGFECTIIEGHRPREKQEQYFREGRSRVRWPRGKHNRVPSDAVDACPYVKGAPSWNVHHCIFFAGVVLGLAAMMGIRIRWGGNWDMDDEIITDQEFQDLVHFERAGEEGEVEA